MNNTIKNLAGAFVGESQARNRYSFYAKIAKTEGYEQIAAIFKKTAEQERQHAKWLFKLINELKKKTDENFDEIKIEATVPTAMGTTIENLKAAIAGESYEYETMYPEFADIAEKEGLTEIATRLRAIAKAELHHKDRYSKLLKELEDGTIFKKSSDAVWICRECGYLHIGTEAPMKCPACDHSQAFYQVENEEY